jgi:hypothetical protein
MRPEVRFGEDALDGSPANLWNDAASNGFCADVVDAPCCLPVLGFHRLAGQRHHLASRDRPKLRLAPGARSILQPRKAILQVTLPPALNSPRVDTHALRDACGTAALGTGQNDSGSERISLWRGCRSHPAL